MILIILPIVLLEKRGEGGGGYPDDNGQDSNMPLKTDSDSCSVSNIIIHITA